MEQIKQMRILYEQVLDAAIALDKIRLGNGMQYLGPDAEEQIGSMAEALHVISCDLWAELSHREKTYAVMEKQLKKMAK